jgi:DNA-3-methyladenine glycosylase II
MDDEAVIEELVVRVNRDQAREIGARWQPWRTVASWYLWRSLDPLPLEI